MPLQTGNIFTAIPSYLPEELTEVLGGREGLRIERILSRGHRSPEGFWYDQEENEWVMLLQGEACLSFEKAGEIVELKPGDYLTIPSHTRHRVEWTSEGEETVWLAIFY